MGQKDVARPCAQVVDCCDQTFLRGGRVMKGLLEAGRDVDGRKDTDVVSDS